MDHGTVVPDSRDVLYVLSDAAVLVTTVRHPVSVIQRDGV